MNTIQIFFAIIGGIAVPFIVFLLNYLIKKRDRKHRLENELDNLQTQQKDDLKTRKEQIDDLNKKRKNIEKSQPDIPVKAYELLIIGRPGVGKTKIIWYFKNIKETPSPTVGKKYEEFKRIVTVNSEDHALLYVIPDIGGEDIYLGEVTDELLLRKPRGIIFVVDHEQVPDKNGKTSPEFSEVRAREHMLAVYSILGLLSRPKRNKCKVVLFLINKQDIWSDKYENDEMKEKFSDHIKKFESIGKTVIVECASALTGANLHQALSEFEKILTSRKSRKKN